MTVDIEYLAAHLDIVIPVRNALPYLKDCLAGLDQYYPDATLFVVDDGSDAETANFLNNYSAANASRCSVETREIRGWFTRTTNQGLAAAHAHGQSPWVVTLNTDCVIGPGAFEELLWVWHHLEISEGQKTGLVGAEGPQPETHPRFAIKTEPGYVTGHCVLFNKELLAKEKLRFPQDDNEVRGFSAQDLFHIASDRALSWEMNRRGLVTAASYWAAIGHHGGKSWGHRLQDLGKVNVKDLGA